jgi:DNA-binding transcriptional MerR regulator
LENQRLNLQTNAGMENTMERNNETTQMLDANIEKVKELFEERIQEVQANINEAKNQRTAIRVVEILGNGQEKICKEIQENNNELRTMQERILISMRLFNEASTQEIKEMIIQSRNME